LEESRDKLRGAHQGAITALSEFDEHANLLRGIANYIVERSY
jgi:hypothetical protein